MSVSQSVDLASYCETVAQQARAASRQLVSLDTLTKNAWLHAAAKSLMDRHEEVLAANQIDIDNAPQFGLSEAAVDRLRLTEQRIGDIATGLIEVAALSDPVGEVIEGSVRPNGLRIIKTRVPLGVVFFIYESRPNVTADAAAICVKSGNAVILRGGKEAAASSAAIVSILADEARRVGLPEFSVQLVETAERTAVGHFLKLDQWIDVAIPRGGEGLIRRVTAEATMPVIKHYDGNCHVYVDRAADLEMARRIVMNAKTQRMGVCNAAESLLIHADVADTHLLPILTSLQEAGIEIRGDQATCERFVGARAATESDWRTEYLGPTISVRIVDNLHTAIDHINQYGSHHTDAIVTDCLQAAEAFTKGVDSAAVMVNASTRFNDGGQFGLGAEIGISTDKFHARGPCGLRELTTYKYIVHGDGHIRQ